MKKFFIALSIVAVLSVPLLSQEKSKPADDSMKDCPMHSQHQSSTAGDAEMNRRGNQGMGFSQDKTQHHFLLSKDGGAIQVTANSADDQASVSQIRMHLKHISHAFQAGDFNIPMLVHDQTPPVLPMIRKLSQNITYEYEDFENGGRVVIKTTDADALKAVHEFLRFQISEHKTGDRLELK